MTEIIPLYFRDREPLSKKVFTNPEISQVFLFRKGILRPILHGYEAGVRLRMGDAPKGPF